MTTNGQTPPGAPRGDMGIGLCLPCCNEHAAGERRLMPEFAVTWAPIPVPGGQVVVLPSCYVHLRQQIMGASRKPLLQG